MKSLSDYMDDPYIAYEPMPLREVHAIRLMIYDEIKDMTLDERMEYHAKNFERMQKEYNFKIAKREEFS